MRARIQVFQEALRAAEQAREEAARKKPTGFTNRLYQADLLDDGTVVVLARTVEPLGDEKVTKLPFVQLLKLGNAELKDFKTLIGWFDDTFWGERAELADNALKAERLLKQVTKDLNDKAPQLAEIAKDLAARANEGESMMDVYKRLVSATTEA